MNSSVSLPPEAEELAGRRLRELASSLPGATAVFRRHKLDFCCGGDIALADAAQRRGLDVQAIAGQLLALDSAAGPELPESPEALIEHIVGRYHDVHRRELPELVLLAEKVERVHRGHADVPAGLAALLRDMQSELEEHMEKEEMVLFPMMLRNPGARLAPPVQRMRAEHDDHGAMLRRLQGLTHDLTAPAEACNTWRALYAGVGKLADDLMEHIHIENNVLFPQYEA